MLYLKLKRRYAFKCPHCANEHYAAPSMAMELSQINHGTGHCLENKDAAFFILRIAADNKKMEAFTDTTDMPFNQLPDSCFTASRTEAFLNKFLRSDVAAQANKDGVLSDRYAELKARLLTEGKINLKQASKMDKLFYEDCEAVEKD